MSAILGDRAGSRRRPEQFRVPVRGGSLAVLRWPGAGPVVLAVHGLASNALSWQPVAECLAGRVTLVAPDLRGRAGSASLPPPYGAEQHVEDLVAVLDALDTERAGLAGHSLGAFLASITAVRAPERAGPVVLVDGGLPLRIGSPWIGQLSRRLIVEQVLGPVRRTYPDQDSFLRTWQRHPALRRDWSPEVEATLLRDVVREPSGLRSSSVEEALRADADAVLGDPGVYGAAARLPGPAVLLWATGGVPGAGGGMYSSPPLAAAALPPQLTSVAVGAVNHLTILLADRGARAVADEVARVNTLSALAA